MYKSSKAIPLKLKSFPLNWNPCFLGLYCNLWNLVTNLSWIYGPQEPSLYHKFSKGYILVYLRLTYFIRVWVNVASSSADSFRVRSFPLVIKLNTIKYCFLVSNLQWNNTNNKWKVIILYTYKLNWDFSTKSLGTA